MIDEGIVIDPSSFGTVVGTVVKELTVTIVLSGVLANKLV